MLLSTIHFDDSLIDHPNIYGCVHVLISTIFDCIIIFRRQLAKSVLAEDEILLSIVSFPLLGVGDFTTHNPGDLHIKGPVGRSLYIPDDIINPHPRFATLTSNIRNRRGGRVNCHVPVFKDTNTRVGEAPAAPADEFTGGEVVPPEVYMEAMSFGMGCCCLQASSTHIAHSHSITVLLISYVMITPFRLRSKALI